MTLVIPDGILEQLVCDSCHKYLSVEPVKVYPNRKTKCGRCCQEDDGGAISMFGLIAEKALFKCINRFDGCRQLLISAQVAEHEKSCIGKQYPCRVCAGTKTIPTYSLMKHFEHTHKRNILKWPMFDIKPDGSGDVLGSFVYKIEDTLYSIYFEVKLMENLLMVGAESMRKDHFKNKQKVIISYGKEKIYATKIKTCDSFKPPQSNCFYIPLENFKKYPFINVAFEITTTPEIIRLAEKTSISSESYQRATDELSTEQEILFSVVNDDAGKIWQPRKVFLSEHFRESYPDLVLTSKENGIRSLESKMDVFLHCRKCQGISQYADEYYRGFFYKEYHYYFVCYNCHQINESLDIKIVKLDTFLLEYSVYENIEFFCSWHCGQSFNNTNIIEHELQCPNQPLRDCPLKDCEHKATLRELENHFRESHKPRVINGKKYSFVLVSNSRFSVEKKQTGSRLKKIVFIYYVWVLTVFVRVEVSWNDEFQTDFEVSFSVCGDKSDKVLMFYNTTTSKIFSKWTQVYPESTGELNS